MELGYQLISADVRGSISVGKQGNPFKLSVCVCVHAYMCVLYSCVLEDQL